MQPNKTALLRHVVYQIEADRVAVQQSLSTELPKRIG